MELLFDGKLNSVGDETVPEMEGGDYHITAIYSEHWSAYFKTVNK